jgi:DUF971 family protein
VTNARLSLLNVQTIGDQLAIAWSDSTESFFGLEELRRACPCAACGGEPDILGNVDRPDVTYTDRSFELVRLGYVGGYAVQPLWGDGHGSGIYSFAFLKRLGAEQG